MRKLTIAPLEAARKVGAKRRGRGASDLDRRTRAIVGKPSAEAFAALDRGQYRGTIAEIELTLLRRLNIA